MNFNLLRWQKDLFRPETQLGILASLRCAQLRRFIVYRFCRWELPKDFVLRLAKHWRFQFVQTQFITVPTKNLSLKDSSCARRPMKHSTTFKCSCMRAFFAVITLSCLTAGFRSPWHTFKPIWFPAAAGQASPEGEGNIAVPSCCLWLTLQEPTGPHLSLSSWYGLFLGVFSSLVWFPRHRSVSCRFTLKKQQATRLKLQCQLCIWRYCSGDRKEASNQKSVILRGTSHCAGCAVHKPLDLFRWWKDLLSELVASAPPRISGSIGPETRSDLSAATGPERKHAALATKRTISCWG